MYVQADMGERKRYTFKESIFPLPFCLPFHWGLLFQERICSCRSKFFPIRVDNTLKGVGRPGKETGSPIIKNGGKTWRCTHLP